MHLALALEQKLVGFRSRLPGKRRIFLDDLLQRARELYLVVSILGGESQCEDGASGGGKSADDAMPAADIV